MKYFLGSDHAGLKLKEFAKNFLKARNLEFEDLGAFNDKRVDYPDFAKKVCEKVSANPNSEGILSCASGIGMSMSANKFKNIRAALCHNEYSAKMAKKHNNANVLCLGEKVSGLGIVEDILSSWCEAEFEKGRHSQRVDKIDSLQNL